MAVQRGKVDPGTIRPGPQNPGKYKQTGPNYATYGDVYGYVYNPIDDQYYKDKKAYEEFLVSSGQIEKPKEAPGLFESVAPIAVTGGALALGQAAGNGLSGMFSSAPAASTPAATQATTAGASNLQGLQGLSQTPPPPVPAPTGVEANLVQTAPVDAGMGAAPFYVPALAAVGTYLAGKSAYDMIKGKEEDKSAQGKAGRGQLAWTTMGLSEVARGLGIGHESTREKQSKKFNQLVESGLMPAELGGEYGIIQDMGHGDKELYGGQLKGRDVWGVSGMFDTFGQDWLGKYTEAQREQIAQKLLDEKLLDSKKGLTRITDEERAKQIANEIALGKGAAPQQPQANAIPRPIANKDAAQKALENWK